MASPWSDEDGYKPLVAPATAPADAGGALARRDARSPAPVDGANALRLFPISGTTTPSAVAKARITSAFICLPPQCSTLNRHAFRRALNEFEGTCSMRLRPGSVARCVNLLPDRLSRRCDPTGAGPRSFRQRTGTGLRRACSRRPHARRSSEGAEANRWLDTVSADAGLTFISEIVRARTDY